MSITGTAHLLPDALGLSFINCVDQKHCYLNRLLSSKVKWVFKTIYLVCKPASVLERLQVENEHDKAWQELADISLTAQGMLLFKYGNTFIWRREEGDKFASGNQRKIQPELNLSYCAISLVAFVLMYPRKRSAVWCWVHSPLLHAEKL